MLSGPGLACVTGVGVAASIPVDSGDDGASAEANGKFAVTIIFVSVKSLWGRMHNDERDEVKLLAFFATSLQLVRIK